MPEGDVGVELVGSGELKVDMEALRRHDPKLAEEMIKRVAEKDRLERIEKEEAETLAKLSDPYKKRYLRAKLLGLFWQAEIAKIEGLTGTKRIRLDEQKMIMWRKANLKLGFAIGNKAYDIGRTSEDILFKNHFLRAEDEVLDRYEKVKDFFDEIHVVTADCSTEGFIYGIKEYSDGVKLAFLIARLSGDES